MNNSSVIFVGGFTIIFGFFAAQSFNADARALKTAEARAAQLQADLIASTGVNLACYHMATPSSTDGLSVTGRSMNGGTLDYAITILSANQANVVSTGKMGSVTVTKRARIELELGALGSWSQWTVKKIYTDPYTLADVLVE